MKQSFTHFYVQSQDGDNAPAIVAHSHDDETNELYYKFLERKKALKLAEAEKKLTPNIMFRVVKCTETFDTGDWI